jgi:hypothetical protein
MNKSTPSKLTIFSLTGWREKGLGKSYKKQSMKNLLCTFLKIRTKLSVGMRCFSEENGKI